MEELVYICVFQVDLDKLEGGYKLRLIFEIEFPIIYRFCIIHVIWRPRSNATEKNISAKTMKLVRFWNKFTLKLASDICTK